MAAEKMFSSGHPCKICMSEVKDNDPAVLCDLCEKWVHTACIDIGETNTKIFRKVPGHGTACIALQSSPSL